MNDPVREIQAFVPAADIEISKQFYLVFGFEIVWTSEDYAFIRHGSSTFFLQKFNHPDFAKSFQVQPLVENVDKWHAQVLGSGDVERFGVRVDFPQDKPWGMRDFPLFDPSSVLWRVAEQLS